MPLDATTSTRAPQASAGAEITPAQCRAARALLSWPQTKLVKLTQISRSTIQGFEAGTTPGTPLVQSTIIKTFRQHGIDFFQDASQVGLLLRVK